MRTSTIAKLGVIVIALIIISQLLSQISPLFLLIVGGLWAYSQGYIS